MQIQEMTLDIQARSQEQARDKSNVVVDMSTNLESDTIELQKKKAEEEEAARRARAEAEVSEVDRLRRMDERLTEMHEWKNDMMDRMNDMMARMNVMSDKMNETVLTVNGLMNEFRKVLGVQGGGSSSSTPQVRVVRHMTSPTWGKGDVVDLDDFMLIDG